SRRPQARAPRNPGPRQTPRLSARPKSRLLVLAEYLPLRALLFVLQAVPSKLSRALCRRLLRGIMACMPKRRRLILSQIQDSFPDGSRLTWEGVLGKSIE